MAGYRQPLTTILSVPPRKPGHLPIKIEVSDVKPVSRMGIAASLPDNIFNKCCKRLFEEINNLPHYVLKGAIARQFDGVAQFPEEFLVEDIRPPFSDLIVSMEGNAKAAKWFGEADTMIALASIFEKLFITESYLLAMSVAEVKLRVTVDSDDVDAVVKEYSSGQGFAEMPNHGDIQIEVYHCENVREHMHWAREIENWLEGTLGSFIMTCKQVMPNAEQPLDDALKLERSASQSSRASVDKAGMTNFANSYRHIAAVSIELADQIVDKLEHTHRFAKKHPSISAARTNIVEKLKEIRRKYSCIMEVPIQPPAYEIYEPWRAKVLAKEAQLYLPIVSVIPTFKELLLDIDVQLDELKANVTGAFPRECQVLNEVSQAARGHPQESTATSRKPPKPSRLIKQHSC